MKEFVLAALVCFLHLSAFRVAETRLPEETELDDEDSQRSKFEDVDKCDGTFCHIGQECVVSEDAGDAVCVCISSCPERSNPVCGSDGVSYDSHCQLHRTACLEGRRISIKSDGLCQEPPTSSVVKEGRGNMSKPVVCYEQNRDQMRSRLVNWLTAGDKAAGSGHQLLRKYFDLMDKNKDGTLDTNEFTELIKINQSISEVVDPSAAPHPILQSLCAEALISISDGDSDWKLNFDEFAACLDPTFKPSGRGCELENKFYPDGTEIPAECNSCVCACGRWVCTVLNCTVDSIGEAENPSEVEHTKEISEAVQKKRQFVVEGSDTKKKLVQETQNQDRSHKARVLPLLKIHHHHYHRNKKRKNHGDKAQ